MLRPEYPEGAASLVAPSGAEGVPVVDLTATVARLRDEAEQSRQHALFLDHLADVLGGHDG